MPKQVGIYFLKGRESLMDVDNELLEMAKREIAHVHSKTQTEDINHYPKQTGPLCKWSTGQCEHYDVCRPYATPDFSSDKNSKVRRTCQEPLAKASDVIDK